LVVAFVTLHFTSACGDDPASVSPKQQPPPRKPTVRVVSGDGQTAEVGTQLSQPLVAEVRDTLGTPARSIVVQFLDDKGSTIDSASTDAIGRVTIRWTLGTTAGPQRVFAHAVVSPISRQVADDAIFSVTATAAAVARVQATITDDLALPGTTLDTVSLVATDRFGNRGPYVPIGWSVESGGGSVRALSDKTDVDGKARAIWTLGPGTGENVLVVRLDTVTARMTVLGVDGFMASTVAVGGTHSCAIAVTGAAYCWGANSNGQLGNGGADAGPHAFPQRVSGGVAFTSLVAGAMHTCGLTAASEAYCWGANSYGQVGPFGSLVPVPTRLTGLKFTRLTAGSLHTCGLTSDGRVLCWGDNTVGELGDGTERSTAASFGSVYRPTPTPILGGHSFVALAAGHFATCAVAVTGEAYCWGANSSRELGADAGKCRILYGPYYEPPESDWACSTQPVQLNADALASVTASGSSFCGVTRSADLVCWGNNFLFPRVMPGGQYSAAWTLGSAACGLGLGGGVSCWSLYGEVLAARPFGDGPTLVNLSSTGSNFCGSSLEQPGRAYCSGGNEMGQVGDGTKEYRRFPVAVALPHSRP